MEEFYEIELNIKKRLEKIEQQSREAGGKPDAWWTERIKSELCNLGHENGYYVNANRCENADDSREWMFDLVWAKGEKGHFREMPLAMECEWSLDEDEIRWDFEKLPVAKCEYHIFIFQKTKSDEVDRLMNEFESAIHEFESSQIGDRYLLAGFSREDDNFKFSLVLA